MHKKNNKLISLIYEHGFTQCTFVKAAKLRSESRLSRIINNHEIVTDEEILSIARVLKLTINEMRTVFAGEQR